MAGKEKGVAKVMSHVVLIGKINTVLHHHYCENLEPADPLVLYIVLLVRHVIAANMIKLCFSSATILRPVPVISQTILFRCWRVKWRKREERRQCSKGTHICLLKVTKKYFNITLFPGATYIMRKTLQVNGSDGKAKSWGQIQ